MTNIMMAEYSPTGNTGNGRCNNGACGMATINPTTGRPNYIVKIARDPADGFRGQGATRMKNAIMMPREWIREMPRLTHAKEHSPKRTVVDLCAG